MNRPGKWLVAALVLVGLLLVAGLLVVQRWVGGDDFKAQVQAALGDALGVAVKIDRIAVDVWPVPALSLSHGQVQTRAVLNIERVEVRPAFAALLVGRLELATLLIRNADLPQAGVEELLAARQKRRSPGAGQGPDAGGSPAGRMPHRIVLDHVTWRMTAADPVTVDADARLGPDRLPDSLSLKVLAGRFQGAQASLARKAQVWTISIAHADGTVKGEVELQEPSPGGAQIALTGRFETRDVELGALLTKAGRSPLSGRLEASTTASARAASAGALLDVLQTHSKFIVHNAVVHGVDLAKAVQSIGLNRGGETRLDTLAGQLDTKGRAVALNNVVARSGVLSANGNVTVAPSRALGGRVNVSLGAAGIGEVVGVPLLVGGTLDAPEVTLTRAALIGAALGTAVMPGVGTGAGAAYGDKLSDKLGETLKGLFGK